LSAQKWYSDKFLDKRVYVLVTIFVILFKCQVYINKGKCINLLLEIRSVWTNVL